MVSQEVVQTEFSVVHGLTRMHGLTRNEDKKGSECIIMQKILELKNNTENEIILRYKNTNEIFWYTDSKTDFKNV